MNKNKQKISLKWNTDVLKTLAKKYKCSTRYIKMIVLKERTPVDSDKIIKEYNEITNEIEEILNNNEL